MRLLLFFTQLLKGFEALGIQPSVGQKSRSLGSCGALQLLWNKIASTQLSELKLNLNHIAKHSTEHFVQLHETEASESLSDDFFFFKLYAWYFRIFNFSFWKSQVAMNAAHHYLKQTLHDFPEHILKIMISCCLQKITNNKYYTVERMKFCTEALTLCLF